jgi:hypothetical protein
MSTVTAISFKPKATRKRLKKEILSDDFKKRKIFRKNIAENFPSHITTNTTSFSQLKAVPSCWCYPCSIRGRKLFLLVGQRLAYGPTVDGIPVSI